MMAGTREYMSRWWALTVPDSWDVEETRDNVTFLLPGNGRVSVSAMKKQEGFVTEDDLRRYAKQFLNSEWTESQANWAELNGIRLVGSRQNMMERFYVSRDALMLAVRYEHGEQNVLNELDAVSILSGMRILS